MIRMGRLTDYGIVLMSQMAAHSERQHNAAELAGGLRLPLPTVSKLLRRLARGQLLTSHRGAKGGYDLARPAEAISVADIIRALEGPIALTLCTVEAKSQCAHEPRCPVQAHWQRINRVIQAALENVSLADMAGPASSLTTRPAIEAPADTVAPQPPSS